MYRTSNAPVTMWILAENTVAGEVHCRSFSRFSRSFTCCPHTAIGNERSTDVVCCLILYRRYGGNNVGLDLVSIGLLQEPDSHLSFNDQIRLPRLIQGVLTFVIVNTMVPADMRSRTVPGFDAVWPNPEYQSIELYVIFQIVPFPAQELIRGNPQLIANREGKKQRITRYFTGNFGLDFKLSRRHFFLQLWDTIVKG